MWDPNSNMFTALQSHTQFIHGLVQNANSTFQFAFTVVYGLHTIAHRHDLWATLNELEEQMTMPWLLMGDFNAIRDMDDRANGTVVQENEIKDFREFMEDCRMTELPTVGRCYTWTNSHVHSRIDRVIVNAQWIMVMPPMEVQVMDPHFSDHSPLCIEMEIIQILAKWYRKDGNTGVNMECIWQNLKKVKVALKGLNRKESVGTTIKVKQMREQLANIQAQMRSTASTIDMFEAEKSIRQKLEKWSMIEESISKHKSRVQWLKLGDSNTAFFFASMKGRASQNQIKILIVDDGSLIKTAAGIEQEIVCFYKRLLGNSASRLPAIDPNVMKQGPVLTRNQQLQLISPFTSDDVFKALQGIDDSKAPSADGFNACFYKKA
ncbi:uncharacterized protein LOC142170347 [Nicotiana tabacum]|uniref:Uncharacterized protein LOC142170347 n=1 Tax=Nicotiana tabacum TaxID=4097 RepID=A0AC58STN0_TOBAC